MKLKTKKPISSLILYVAASIIAILGVTLLIINVLVYRTNVNQYVAQGNAIGVVTAQLIPSELLPGIFEPISVYWGIALLLTGVGIINQKVSKYLATLTKNEVCDTAVETEIANNTVIVDEIGAAEVKKAIE
jgi:hypothetical protein